MRTLKYLFCFKSELNKDLLKLLIDIIDAELFKTIFLEDFKSINVEDSNINLFHFLSHSFVNSLKFKDKQLTLWTHILPLFRSTLYHIPFEKLTENLKKLLTVMFQFWIPRTIGAPLLSSSRPAVGVAYLSVTVSAHWSQEADYESTANEWCFWWGLSDALHGELFHPQVDSSAPQEVLLIISHHNKLYNQITAPNDVVVTCSKACCFQAQNTRTRSCVNVDTPSSPGSFLFCYASATFPKLAVRDTVTRLKQCKPFLLL